MRGVRARNARANRCVRVAGKLMGAEPYRVDYNVVGMIYFESGRELSGPDFARLWSGTRILGKQNVLGDFWHQGVVPTGKRRFELGSLELIQPLLELGDMPVFGGGTYVTRNVARSSTLDADFYYAHGQSSRSVGYPTLPSLLYSVSGQWFEHAGPELVLAHLKDHFEVADRYCPPYGLIDVSASEDCYGGMVYEPYIFLNSSMSRWLEHVKWCYACTKRRDQVRSIYWGNYLGSIILERLGGRERFLSRFRQQASFPDGRPAALVWEFANGVFVSLCLDPLGCKPRTGIDGWAAQNLHWLVIELGSHGVLDPWFGHGSPFAPVLPVHEAGER
jgi:hypothetical protein